MKTIKDENKITKQKFGNEQSAESKEKKKNLKIRMIKIVRKEKKKKLFGCEKWSKSMQSRIWKRDLSKGININFFQNESGNKFDKTLTGGHKVENSEKANGTS